MCQEYEVFAFACGVYMPPFFGVPCRSLQRVRARLPPGKCPNEKNRVQNEGKRESRVLGQEYLPERGAERMVLVSTFLNVVAVLRRWNQRACTSDLRPISRRIDPAPSGSGQGQQTAYIVWLALMDRVEVWCLVTRAARAALIAHGALVRCIMYGTCNLLSRKMSTSRK